MKNKKILFISPLNISLKNGNIKRQLQIMQILSNKNSEVLDYLSLWSSPRAVRLWAKKNNLNINVISGFYPLIARIYSIFWYYTGVLLSGRLQILRNFPFYYKLSIPNKYEKKYDMFFCFYAWSYLLLGLDRLNSKVTIDLNDVMANRYQRTGIRRWISLEFDDEKYILTNGAKTLSISEFDQDLFHNLYGVKPPILPYYTNITFDFRGNVFKHNKIFAGYLAAPSPINDQALKLITNENFINEIKSFGCELMLAGGVCSSINTTKKLELIKNGVHILGYVNSEADFYNKCDIFLNPVGPSSGIKIKSVEALLSGCKLITTVWGSDATLEKFFGNNIYILKWPFDVYELASACEKMSRSSRRSKDDKEKIISYINYCELVASDLSNNF